MSELQKLAQKRNSSKGRIKGLRNNIRGLLDDKDARHFLNNKERKVLEEAEKNFDEILRLWNHQWKHLKNKL